MARKRNKIVPMKYPVGHEYAYRTSLLRLNKELKLQLKKYMAPEVPQMVLEVTSVHLSTGEIRRDAWQQELNEILHKIGTNMGKPVNKAIKDMTVIGPKVNEYNKDQWRKLIRSQYGVNPTAENPDRWNSLMRNWSHNNVLLIKDIPFKTLHQIRDMTVEALRSGKPAKDMANDIFELMGDRTDVSESRCKLIARDQIAKLNGNLTRERQEDIGVSKYIWRTVGDERVRDSHDEVDGEIFDWDNPPSETEGNHPGEDYQCRCFAEPILPEALAFEASLLEEVE